MPSPRQACRPGAGESQAGGPHDDPVKMTPGPQLRRLKTALGTKDPGPPIIAVPPGLGSGKNNFLLEARRRASPGAGKGREDLPHPAPGRGCAPAERRTRRERVQAKATGEGSQPPSSPGRQTDKARPRSQPPSRPTGSRDTAKASGKGWGGDGRGRNPGPGDWGLAEAARGASGSRRGGERRD